MNVAVITAGGYGSRTEQDIPKQFMSVYEKPLLIYTLENFQNHPEIDSIIVICLEGWQEVLRAYARQYHITKLNWIVSGGADGQESIKNGIDVLKGICEEDDIILIHDGVRPFLPKEVITDAIVKSRKYGSGVSAIRCQETIVQTNDGVEGTGNIERSEVMRVQTPQACLFGKARWAYEEAEKRGIHGEVALNTLLLHLGEHVFFSHGSEKNIKITTVDDLDLFKALLRMKKEDWIH
ncbi:MAG: 2-C-methyl-D-erythritol 4-phosphate cytidylyltransferase [Lachnospiraceae bacterium]|nr:2-C-methyl-D-erythritol 4-phosphate cytidylyltransferase [Lachnospiraceae bacterium]